MKKAKKTETVPALAKAIALAKAHAMIDETLELFTHPGKEPDYPFDLTDAIEAEVFRLLREMETK